MYDKDFAELVKIAAEKLKEDTVYKMLTRSEDYQKESDERDKAERNYEQLDLTMEQRKVLFDEQLFNSCFAVRYLLEKANTIEQALNLLMQLPIASNYNILIADKRGKMVVVECTPNIKKIGEAKSVDDGYLVCTVNSFISDKLKPYDFAKGDDYHSYTRYSVVMDNCINNVKNNDPVVETQKLLKGEYGFMCQYDDEPDFETIWSSIFDLSNLMIYRAEGDPRRKKFITDKRLHNIVIGRKDAEK